MSILLSKDAVLPRPKCFHGIIPISDRLYYIYLLGELKNLVFPHTKKHWSPKILMGVEYLAGFDPRETISLLYLQKEIPVLTKSLKIDLRLEKRLCQGMNRSSILSYESVIQQNSTEE